MVPNDVNVQNLLQSVMQFNKIQNLPNISSTYDFAQKMIYLNENNSQ